MFLVFGQDQTIIPWALHHLGRDAPREGFGPAVTIGIAADFEGLVAAAVYHNARDHDIGLTFCATTPLWATKGNIAAIFRYPFGQLGVERVTCLTRKSNKRARKLMKGLGFQHEGTHRKGWHGIETACSYGLLAEDCKWVEESDGRQGRQETA